MTHSAIVLGAGVVGISTALCLRERGWDVALVDRSGFGAETSSGNAGIIQADTVEPYAMPRGFGALAAIATGRSNDVHFRAGELPSHASALLRYWWNSSPRRHRCLSRGYAELVNTALAEHQRWITASGVDHLIRREGYRVMFRALRNLEAAASAAERIERRYGVPHRTLTRLDLAQAEPALQDAGAGALQFPSAWTVSDPAALMAAYGETLLRRGGAFYQANADSLRRTSDEWTVDTADGAIGAAHVVIALGPWSPQFLRRFGVRVAMIYKRGYHARFPGTELDLTLVDADFGYVLAPMHDGLRLTSGAHLAGLEAPADPIQLTRAVAAARTLLDLGEAPEDEPWAGTRPFLPGMLPIIGASTRAPGLWLNFGHGHQGLTLGPSSGRLLAELMTGEEPFVDPASFAPVHGRRGQAVGAKSTKFVRIL